MSQITKLQSYIALFLVSAFAFEGAVCQVDGSQRYRTPSEIKSLQDSLKAYDEEIELLQHFLEASTVDPSFVQYARVKSWILNNPVLRDSLFYTLLQADSSLQSEAGADAEILSTPSNDLLQVRFGTAIFKGMTLQRALDRSTDRSLYRKIADSYRYSKDIELRDPAFRFDTPIQPELLTYSHLLEHFNPILPAGLPEQSRGTLELSVDRLAVRIGPTWGGEIRLGMDEINHPFWANGTIEVLATYKRNRFGIIFPFGPGRSNVMLYDPFLFRARRLTGARGFLGEFDYGPVGGSFSINRFSREDLSTATDPNRFWFIGGMVNFYYSFGVALDPSNRLRAKVGIGAHRVGESGLIQNPADPASDYVSLGQWNYFVSPYVKIEYLNGEATERYRAALQFYNLTVMLYGSMEIVPRILSLEVKYVWPLGNVLKNWEYPEFFLISPKLRIIL